MFTEKYKPTNLTEVLGNQISIKALYSFLTREKEKEKEKKIALLHGPPGTGKTLSIQLLLKEKNYNILDIANDEEREKDFMKKVVQSFVKTPRSVFGKLNALVINDVDCVTDHGFLSSLVDIAKESKVPIFCTCNDLYLQALKPLRALSTEIKFSRPSSLDPAVSKYFQNIIKKENLKTSFDPNTFQGDMRNALNQLQFYLGFNRVNEIDKNMNISIFDSTNIFLSQANDFESKYPVFFYDTEMLPLMIHENHVINNLYGISEVAQSADDLSDVDIFESEVECLTYIPCSLSRATLNCHSKVFAKFTSWLGKLSTMNKNLNFYKNFNTNLSLMNSYTTFRLDYLYYIAFFHFYNLIQNPNGSKPAQLIKSFLSLLKERKGEIREESQQTRQKTLEYVQDITLIDSPLEYKSVDSKLKRAITKELDECQSSSKETLTLKKSNAKKTKITS